MFGRKIAGKAHTADWFILSLAYLTKRSSETEVGFQTTFFCLTGNYAPNTFKRFSTGSKAFSPAGASMPPITIARAKPAFGQVPFFGDGGVGQRVVVLQVRAHAGGGKRCPDGVLRHRVRMVRPNGEVGGIRRKLLLQAFDDVLVFEEQNGRRACFEQV